MIRKFRNLVKGKRRLLDPQVALGTPVSRFINQMSSARETPVHYLEIGVEYGYTFEAIFAHKKTAVDPHFRFKNKYEEASIESFQLESDVFFELISKDSKFDIIFLDGLHTAEQTWSDFKNSLKHLSAGGVIIIDDTVPSDVYSSYSTPEKTYAAREENGKENDYKWHGDVFRVVMKIRSDFKEIKLATITDVPNPFTVCWNISQPAGILSDLLPNFSFQEIFSNGIPNSFNPKHQSEVIKELKNEK